MYRVLISALFVMLVLTITTVAQACNPVAAMKCQRQNSELLKTCYASAKLQMQPIDACLEGLKVIYAQCKQDADCLDQNYEPVIPAAPGKIKCLEARINGVCRPWPKFTDHVPK